MPTKVLFLCEHAAGKSLIAATYFHEAAVAAGLDVEISVAGTDPDGANMPDVVEALTAEGYDIGWSPRLVSVEDVSASDHVISIGCDPSEIPGGTAITEWDVPMLSEDLPGSMSAIRRKVFGLVRDLEGSQI